MQKKIWNSILNFSFKRTTEKSKVKLPENLTSTLGFTPKNKHLFIEALTPRSAHKITSNGNSFNYERLEFLGDAMLGAVIAEYLYNQAPDEKEGYLTKMRSKIVSRKHLNEIGKDLGLPNYIGNQLKKGVTLGNNVPGDMFESLIGAIYEDQGFEMTKKFISKTVIEPYVDLNQLENRIASYKSLILEWSQKTKKNIAFQTEREKNAEDQVIFVTKLILNEKEVAKGRGSSKKKAEEKAAKRTFFAFQNEISTINS